MKDFFFLPGSIDRILHSEDEKNALKQERDSWRSAWHDARIISGKMYWDGASWGYTMGAQGKGDYGILARQDQVAHDVSVLIYDRRCAYDDVGLEVADDDALEANMLPLTYFVTRYNTGDEILFQYIKGKKTVVRVKTHDNILAEGNVRVKDPKANIFKGIK